MIDTNKSPQNKKARRKQLPKDFEKLLEKGDIKALKAVFDAAVDAKKAAHVATLLTHGADVNATNREGLTPLEYGLQRASNIDLESMANIARTLLSAGAIKRDYAKMARVLCELLRKGKPLPADQLDECEAVVRSVMKDRDGDVDKLAEVAVTWVLLNPNPIELSKPTYSR